MHKLSIIFVRIRYSRDFSKKTFLGRSFPSWDFNRSRFLSPICAPMHLEHENMTRGQFWASTGTLTNYCHPVPVCGVESCSLLGCSRAEPLSSRPFAIGRFCCDRGSAQAVPWSCWSFDCAATCSNVIGLIRERISHFWLSVTARARMLLDAWLLSSPDSDLGNIWGHRELDGTKP